MLDDRKLFMPWLAIYVIGIDPIDQQHQELVGIINEYHEASILKEEPESVVSCIVEKFLATIKFHFDFEETFCQQLGLDLEQDHLHEHTVILSAIRELANSSGRGFKGHQDTVRSLRRTLKDHFLGLDNALGQLWLEARQRAIRESGSGY